MTRPVHLYINAGYPLIYHRTTENERAFQYILTDLKKNGLGDLRVFVWKVTTGLYLYSDGPDVRVAMDFLESLRYITGDEGGVPADSVYVFHGVRRFLEAPGNIQQLRDAAYALRTVGSHIICIGSDCDIPPELEDAMTVVDFPLPDRAGLRDLFRRMVDEQSKVLTDIEIDDAALEMAAENALGLTAFRAESAAALSLIETNKLDLSLIREEKRQALKQAGALEFIPAMETMDDLGGFDAAKAHVRLRSAYFKDTERAREFGITTPPKGILVVGLPGTGKTLLSKCVANELDLPLYRLDIGSLFKGIVGSSEETTRRTLRVLETMAPAVLLLDEFEKTMAGLESSGRSDSGVTSRVIGTILTWTQESRAPIYKVAACNTLRNLDPAIMRRGRWDAVFSVDLPSNEEVKEIFSIHLKKRGKDPDKFDLDRLGKVASGFVGAEIESAVVDALYFAFTAGEELKTEHVERACSEIIPISKTSKEEIDKFRKWIKNRAIPVSTRNDDAVTTSTAESGEAKRAVRSPTKLDMDSVTDFVKRIQV